MKFPNAYFGNGPGQGEDMQSQREMEAYQRNRLQMTVATSSFAGVALVGMFCSCLWFLCCRNSSSKTRKKTRTTWASAEAGLQNNPYSYEGYMESQGHYIQMSGHGEIGNDGVAPYISNPLYHPNSLGADNALPNPYDFDEQYGFGQQGGAQSKAQLSQLFCGNTDANNPKDVPPSYTALFFAASDAANDGGKGGNGEMTQRGDPRITSIQPIHLKVTSSSQQEKKVDKNDADGKDQKNCFEDGFLIDRSDPSTAPPVSLLSVESEPGTTYNDTKLDGNEKPLESSDKPKDKDGERTCNPPPYNPGHLNQKY